MKLYELTEQYKELANLDVEPELLADTLEGIEGEIEIKAENLLSVVSNMSSDVDAIDNEIKRLQARKKTIANRQDWLREYLRSNMEAMSIDKISCPLFTITLRKATQAVSIGDLSLVPDEYKKVTVSPDKVKIKNDLKAGADIPGCELVDGKRGLMIK
jgi:hypothetical protein